jgi:hypothetical protein
MTQAWTDYPTNFLTSKTSLDCNLFEFPIQKKEKKNQPKFNIFHTLGCVKIS